MEENRRKDEQERELQALLVELQENADGSTVSVTDTEQEEKWNERKADTENEINVLNLPPRKEVHGQKKKRAHIKLRKPFIRLAIVIVLVIIVVGILFFLNGGGISI
jgi:hypothetical protein